MKFAITTTGSQSAQQLLQLLQQLLRGDVESCVRVFGLVVTLSVASRKLLYDDLG